VPTDDPRLPRRFTAPTGVHHSPPTEKADDNMKSFRCGDVIPGCTRHFSGTAEDILAQVARHAYADHGGVELSPAVQAQVESAMTLIGA
jgi:predicted small metal-binding protein